MSEGAKDKYVGTTAQVLKVTAKEVRVLLTAGPDKGKERRVKMKCPQKVPATDDQPKSSSAPCAGTSALAGSSASAGAAGGAAADELQKLDEELARLLAGSDEEVVE